MSHPQGVLGMSWCQQDPSLLLSSAKDNRTVVWDVGTTDVMTELPTGTNWNFDVQVGRMTDADSATIILAAVVRAILLA